jgi:hypothetical protein
LVINILRGETSQDASEALPEVAGFQTFGGGRISAFANTHINLLPVEGVENAQRHVLSRNWTSASRGMPPGFKRQISQG